MSVDPSLKDQPLLVAGKLPKKYYADLQEFVEDLVKIVRVPTDLISVIQGADGQPGRKGDSGSAGQKGDKGDPGKSFSATVSRIPIPNEVSFVDIPFFDSWELASYTIGYSGQIDSLNVDIPDFDPVDGIVGVGSIVAIYGTPVTSIRCYLLFSAGVAETPNANFILKITKFS